MKKALTEMTLEELWELFPISLSEHMTYWNEWYTEEEKRISALFPHIKYRMNHIGSTAINDIWAKPIIDILMEIPNDISMETIKQTLLCNGYICMSENEKRISFNFGYTNEGFAEKVYHLHLRYMGDNDELYFRDYLNDHPQIAKQYEELKLSLWKKYEHDRDGYTLAKEAFVTQRTETAKAKYGNRYEENYNELAKSPHL